MTINHDDHKLQEDPNAMPTSTITTKTTEQRGGLLGFFSPSIILTMSTTMDMNVTTDLTTTI